MKKVAVMTDSNSGITQKEARKLGIRVVPMPFYIDGELYYENITLTQKEFYEKLSGDADISTSQPSPADVMEIWEELLDEYDEVVHIHLSCGLSTSRETAMMLPTDLDGRVFVVKNQRITVTQRLAVMDALELAAAGRSGQEIHDILMREKLEASIYITVDTLKYLKKGGRVTPAAAALGTVLNLKPVLTIQGEKLDAFAKVRGLKSAKKVMKEAMEKDIKERFRGKRVHLEAAHTCTEDEAAQWKKEMEESFPGHDIHMAAPSLCVARHIGPGAPAVVCSRYGEYSQTY